MSNVRVLVVDDSPTVRHHLVGLINEMPNLTVVGEAADGQAAVEQTAALEPDVITMDIQMPHVDGLEATRRIMRQVPTPIVIVSGLVNDQINLSFQAVEAGALAVISKPSARHAPTFSAQQRQLTNTLMAMAGVRVIRRWNNGTGEALMLPLSVDRLELVAIGASAGGPSALNRILSALPADFNLPVLVAQHMPPEFVAGLVRWLDNTSPLQVRLAAQGDILRPGVVYLAPGDAHLTVIRRGYLLVAELVYESGASLYQPSIDHLFHSVAATCGAAAAGVILTGMGSDGADGLLAMRRAGAVTFAQDQASSAVFGMPAAAIDRGAVTHILPIDHLHQALMTAVTAVSGW
ncbi:MAG: chemotaxis-specific protein-glutamate methyltransferase CheB [Anaerolineaceae bacterium]|nr:chemotaxis-specific protein-glutamate methyltransferase CheB [Anaerolineaceae bacterium]